LSLRKRCSRAVPAGAQAFCATSPRCEHPWHYDFRVNRKRYRASTETSDKQRAKDIESKERSRILEGRHGIRRQPDITFRTFAETYHRDYSVPNKRSASRDAEIIKVLNRAFGSLMLHEITAHRIEQFKRERLAGKWRAHGQTSAPRPLTPGTVNRELDALRGILTKTVEWGKLVDSPMRGVKRLKNPNRRTCILSDDEQRRLLDAAPRKLRAIVLLALITGARIGELLALKWEDVDGEYLTFLETKNGRSRRITLSPSTRAVLDTLPRSAAWVFANTRGDKPKPYTVNGCRHVFDRAVVRAKISPAEDVTLHTLRHTALSRMIEAGHDDYTVMEISGHSSTRMLARYTHPREERKASALESFSLVVTPRSHEAETAGEDTGVSPEIAQILKDFGGRREDRTRDLRIANAALSQLS
jgi:integrase